MVSIVTYGAFIGEDADDHFGPPLDLAVEVLDRVGLVQLGSMLGRERHVGEHIGLSLIEAPRKAASLGAWAAWGGAGWRPPPLRSCGFGVVLSEGGGDEGGDDAPETLKRLV
jgi:hypothetical protein